MPPTATNQGDCVLLNMQPPALRAIAAVVPDPQRHQGRSGVVGVSRNETTAARALQKEMLHARMAFPRLYTFQNLVQEAQPSHRVRLHVCWLFNEIIPQFSRWHF